MGKESKKNLKENKKSEPLKEEKAVEAVEKDTVKAEAEDAEKISENKNAASEENWKEKAEEYLDRYQRTFAEFDNYRKRTVKEKAMMYDDASRATVAALLPAVDNLERALASVKDEEKENGFYTGVKMILKQIQESLASIGVEEIPAMGEKFDPLYHSAVMHEDNDEYGENEIIFVLLKGYKYKDKVIRPSMVKVAN